MRLAKVGKQNRGHRQLIGDCIVGGVRMGSIVKYDDISGRYVGGLNWGSSFAGDRNGIGIHGGVDAD